MCGMCEAHVNNVIRTTVPEAKKVHASRKKGEATFLSDHDIDVEKLTAAVNATGYTCSDVRSETFGRK